MKNNIISSLKLKTIQKDIDSLEKSLKYERDLSYTLFLHLDAVDAAFKIKPSRYKLHYFNFEKIHNKNLKSYEKIIATLHSFDKNSDTISYTSKLNKIMSKYSNTITKHIAQSYKKLNSDEMKSLFYKDTESFESLNSHLNNLVFVNNSYKLNINDVLNKENSVHMF